MADDDYELLREQMNRLTARSEPGCAKCGATTGTFTKRPKPGGGVVTLCDSCANESARRDMVNTFDGDPMLDSLGSRLKAALDAQGPKE